MNADTTVTATFDLQSSPASVLTGAPSVTATGVGFSGSATPNGLPTQADFEYGLDPKYTGGGPLVYGQSTPPQPVGSDFASHTIGRSPCPACSRTRSITCGLSPPTATAPPSGLTRRSRPEAAPAPGPPTVGKTFNIAPVSGFVLIKVNGKFVPLTGLDQIPWARRSTRATGR